jgi:hypothetical protein
MSDIIGTTIYIASLSLQVAEKSFSDLLTFNDAVAACSALGSGWRLPTKLELDVMILEIPELRDEYYWSSTPEDGYNYDTYLVYENSAIEYPFTEFYDPGVAGVKFKARAVYSPIIA